MVPAMTTAALTRVSRQQLLATRPRVVIAPLEWPAAPISFAVDQARQRSVRRGRGPEDLVDDEAHVTRLVADVPTIGTTWRLAA